MFVRRLAEPDHYHLETLSVTYTLPMLADYVQNKHIDQNLSLAGHHAVSRGNDGLPSSTGRAHADQRLRLLFLTHQLQQFACTYDALLYFNSIA